jgi:hypothetical protein
VILLEDQIGLGQRIPTNLQTDIFSVQHITHKVILKTPRTRYTDRHHSIHIIHGISSSDNQSKVTMFSHVYTGRLTPQERFARNIDPGQPEKAISSYQELMYQHTMQQYERVTTSSGSGPPRSIATPPKLLDRDSTSTVSSVSTVSSTSS